MRAKGPRRTTVLFVLCLRALDSGLYVVPLIHVFFGGRIRLLQQLHTVDRENLHNLYLLSRSLIISSMRDASCCEWRMRPFSALHAPLDTGLGVGLICHGRLRQHAKAMATNQLRVRWWSCKPREGDCAAALTSSGRGCRGLGGRSRQPSVKESTT